ncbi:MAG: recombinase family protein, partial [Pyrinomonadaceae bacterium]|nr:recombinase family protein [Pyrinomonadaceae bacterium]
VVDESRAQYVQMIFSEYAAGNSIDSIVRKLAEMGAPPPKSKQWRSDAILYLIKNPTYMGEYRAFRTKPTRNGKRISSVEREDTISSECPAIISKKTWEQAQAMRAANRSNPASKKRNYLLRGKIRCGICGMGYSGYALSATTHITKQGEEKQYPERRYYRCISTGREYTTCGNLMVLANRIEERVWSDIESFLSQPSKVIERLLVKQREFSKAVNTESRSVVKLQAQIDKLDRQRKKIVKAIGAGTITHDDAKEAIQELNGEKNALVLRIKKIEDLQDNTSGSYNRGLDSTRDLLDALSRRFHEGLTDQEKAQLVRHLVHSVVIEPLHQDGAVVPHAVITYVFDAPLPGKGDNIFSGKTGTLNRLTLEKMNIELTDKQKAMPA